MLSWQRISTLVRRTKGPLFFFDERELQEPIVVLPLSVYESLLRPEEKKGEGERIRVPVRLETIPPTKIEEGGRLVEEKTLAPDLRSIDSEPEQILVMQKPTETPLASPEAAESPAIMTPPASFVDERSFEERFYFQPPLAEEYR